MFNMETIKKNEDYSPNINEIEEEDKLSIQNITSFTNNDIKDSSENHPFQNHIALSYNILLSFLLLRPLRSGDGEYGVSIHLPKQLTD